MKPKSVVQPPRWATRLLHIFCPSHLLEEVEGDLEELFEQRIQHMGQTQARLRYVTDVLSLMRPSVIKQSKERSTIFYTNMLRNYLTIAFRNLTKQKGYSFINITGLATGMAVAILIGLWIYDELSFNKQFKNHERIAQVWQFVSFSAEKSAYDVMPIPLGDELREKYSDFEAVSLAVRRGAILASGENQIARQGRYTEPDFIQMMSVPVVKGTRFTAKDVHVILLSESTAQAMFGTGDPINQVVKISNKETVKVIGVYKDFPYNSDFYEASFLAPWNLLLSTDEGTKRAKDQWDENSYLIYAQLKPGADFDQVSAKIKDIRMRKDNPPAYKPEFYLYPMDKWHLYSDFEDGVIVGGLIEFVWLFGIIGAFVLLLACINFMNLSTARSEKRAREVGIRKAIGSVRGQLIVQFFCESLLLSLLAFVLALAIVLFALPLFNQIADKRMTILWLNPWFWLVGIGFSVFTGLIAGSYPALYLSSFNPVKVLKGTFRAGRWSAIPRQVLVSFQFTVSILLIIGTIIVFRQIEHAKDRPVGYTRNGLIEVSMNTPDLHGHYAALRTDLKNTGVVAEMAEANAPITVQYGGTTDISWNGKTPDMHPLVMVNQVTHEYGKTIDWQIKEGRDFSREYSTDSSAVILNEEAAKLMNFKHPIGERVKSSGKEFIVIGVIKNLIKQSPFESPDPSVFIVNYRAASIITIKLAPQSNAADAISHIEDVFRKYNPSAPFEYKFVDEEYARKFSHEERIGKLAGIFASLAVLISVLGLFGLASFVAEQRTKEIGIRKILGATMGSLWQLLTKEFVVLVLISFVIATPISWYFLSKWLQYYEYRTSISWWIFVVTGAGALLLTILTVSFQSIKAALINPVRALRSE
ncbi:ABC transporter permease [Xanthocytophaga flava]|uniref:ABC transporter permease n=1 Tax=Xanthocytophaga flava TaxID=3048013 RepID=UPI0028D4211A|nr:ABC transporter permease [Xanthocytophaga flavus]MDJ1473615.1 ABC transporter permease [Xanthocytophaga flavus]